MRRSNLADRRVLEAQIEGLSYESLVAADKLFGTLTSDRRQTAQQLEPNRRDKRPFTLTSVK
jgi:hypothetical protein